ncbi:MAG: energy transducer TonB [Chloroflexia bacterium]|nr:energy transducer TonB [Chloroflexia bacterium]
MLESEDIDIEDVVVTCYLGGPTNRKPICIGESLYIKTAIKYPTVAKENKIEGIVELSYIVDETGEIGEVKVIRGIGFGCDEEAIRIVKSLPKYHYGTKNGIPAEYELTIKIEFKLNEN